MAALAATAGVVVFAEIPGSSRFMYVLHKTGHPIAFAIISVCLMQLLRHAGPLARSQWKLSASVFILAIGLGVATEAAQLFTNRGSSAMDVVSDALGAVLGISIVWLLSSRRRQRPVLVVGALAALLAFAPLLWCVAAYGYRDTQFPLLAQPESPLLRYFMSTHARRPQIAMPPRADATAAFHVPLGRGNGLHIDEPFPDWRGYGKFCVELANPGPHDLKLVVRIHDRTHNWESDDRLNIPVVLAPGARRVVTIPMDTIERAPVGRAMDLQRIENVAIFATAPESEGAFYVGRIWLEK